MTPETPPTEIPIAEDAPPRPFEGDDAVVGEHLDAAAQVEDGAATSDETGLEMPILRIPLEGVPVGVLKAENGDRMIAVGPVAVVFQIPIGAAGAEGMADALRPSAIKVATVGDMNLALAAGMERKRAAGRGR